VPGRAAVRAEDERWCECDHARTDHVDYAQRCDHCECQSYRGPVIAARPTPVTLYTPYGPVEAVA
jgi:hypothetical protein